MFAGQSILFLRDNEIELQLGATRQVDKEMELLDGLRAVEQRIGLVIVERKAPCFEARQR